MARRRRLPPSGAKGRFRKRRSRKLTLRRIKRAVGARLRRARRSWMR
jgi:hypothetical protein